jgi:hypothetical protein
MFATFTHLTAKDQLSVMSAYTQEELHKKFIVWNKAEGYRVYDDMMDFHKCQRPHTWHEVILDKPQKLKFDIDAKSSMIATDEEYAVVFDEIMAAIKDTFFVCYGIDLCVDDIIVTKSHGVDAGGKYKRSNHIIIDHYYVSNSAQAREFTSRLLMELPGVTVLDTSVNKRTQNFRCIGCHKQGDPKRTKVLVTAQHPTHVYITNVIDCRLLRDIVHDDGVAYQEVPANLEEIIQKHIPPEFRFRSCTGSNILLNRISPSYCEICEETHHKDNSMYLTCVENDAVIYIYEKCHQKPTESILRETYNKPAVQPCGSIESYIKTPEWYAKKVAPVLSPTTVPPTYNVYCEPQLRDFELVPTLFVRAMMKMGKTKSLLKYMADHFSGGGSVIRFVSFRQTFSHNIKQVFPEFKMYSDSKGMLYDEKLIIQVESLWRLAITVGDTPPDLLILDECEAIIEQFDSGLLRHFSECFAKFVYLLRYSKHVVAMDANLSQRSINVINKYRGDRPSVMHTNTYQNACDDKYYITTDKIKWLAMLNEMIGDDKIVIASSSISDAKVIHSMIAASHPGVKIGIYSSETSQKVKNEHFADVGAYWSLYDVLIYTPTVSAGVSFELKHFNKMFGYFTDQSCPVEVCTQMMGRIRDVSDHTFFIYLALSPAPLPIACEEIRSRVVSHRTKLQSTYDEMGITLMYGADGALIMHESDYFTVWLENTRCRNISRRYFGRQMVYVLQSTGSSCIELTDEVYEELTGCSFSEDGEMTPEVLEVAAAYTEQKTEQKDKQIDDIVAAPDLTDEEYAEIQSKEELCDTDRAGVARYKLRKYYNYEHPLTHKFVKTYSGKKIKRNYKNIVRLQSGLTTIQATEHTRYVNIHENGAEYQFMDLNTRYVGEQHRLALCMLKVGGWTSLDDTSYRHFSEFNLEFYFSVIHDACREFNLRQVSSRANPKSITDMMSNILDQMYGVKLNVVDGTCKLKQNTKFTKNPKCTTKPLVGLRPTTTGIDQLR